MVEPEEGVTHSPPMKIRSVCSIGTDASAEIVIRAPCQGRPDRPDRIELVPLLKSLSRPLSCAAIIITTTCDLRHRRLVAPALRSRYSRNYPHASVAYVRSGDPLMSISGKRRLVVSKGAVALLLLPALAVLSACSSSASSASASASSGSGSGSGAASSASAGAAAGLPANVQIPVIQNLTGDAGFAGLDTQQGQRVAIAQINSTHYLGNTTLSLKYTDTQSTPQLGAEAASSAVNSSAPLAFGPVGTPVSIAVAPIVQRGGLPTIFTSASGPGVNLGANTYTLSAPYQDVIIPTLGAYLKAKGIKSLGIMSNTDNPGAIAPAQVLVNFANQNGIKTIWIGDLPSTTTDFTASAAKIAAAKPSAVFMLLFGNENVTAIRQLRADGYTGVIV